MTIHTAYRIALSSLCCFLCSCSQQPEWEKSVTWKEFQLAHLPGVKEYPGTGAVILLDEGSMEIVGSGELEVSVYEQHRIIRILTPQGERFANVVIPYGSGSTVDDIQARTITPDSRITVLDEKNVFDVSLYPNFVFFSDQRAKIFTLPGVEDGSVVEYRYKIIIRNRTFWHSWTFQHDVPTVISRFTLVKPSEWEAPYRTYGIDVTPRVTSPPAGFKSQHMWEAKNIAPLPAEIGMPPRNETTDRLAIAPLGFKAWGDVTRWYNRLSAPRMKCGAAAAAFAQQLVAGASSDEEKLRRIFEWVRDRVRYVAVEIGIGGFQPHPADDVFKNLYGDCKDMTTILCALAQEAGVNVHQVLVSTWPNGRPDTSFPSPLQFNHAIAYAPSIGEQGTWMDATEKGCPFGEIPWYDQGLPVLVVGSNGEDEIKITPMADARVNRTVIRWDITLDGDGSGRVRGETSVWGSPAAELREQFTYMSSSARRQWVESHVAARCSGARVDSFEIFGEEPVPDSMRIFYSFRSRTVARQRAAGMVFRPGEIIAPDLPEYFTAARRRHPIRFRYGSRTELEVTLRVPEGWDVVQPPEGDSVRSPLGWAEWRWNAGRGSITVASSITLFGEEIPAHRYEELQSFLDAVREKGFRELLLGKSSPG
jgi:hypothetical protein